MRKLLTLLLMIALKSLVALADNGENDYFFSRVDYQQGLSNSAVLCLFQDNTGLMWFGTYDGVNCWDGKTMEVFRSDFSENRTLTNNIIHSIAQADGNCLWFITHLGVNRFSPDARQIVDSYDMSEGYRVFSNTQGNTWVINQNQILYYNTHHRRFLKPRTAALPLQEFDQRGFVTEDGTFWVFPSHTGDIRNYSLNSFNADSLSTKLTVSVNHFHSKPIEDIFYQNGIFCFIDSENDLYMYDINRKSKIYIRNISSLVQRYGTIKGVVPFYDDVMIGFLGNGLIRLRASKKYEEELVNQNIRIYGLYRDPHQGMLWIASDGQGAVMYAKKYSIAHNMMLKSLSPNLSRQVRSLLTDEHGGLWFGTKGDGLIHLPHYEQASDGLPANATVYSPGSKQPAASYTKWDKEFQVYKLLRSHHSNGFWIGAGEPGLFFYSFADDAVHPISFPPSVQAPTNIHDLHEIGDTVLYVTTASTGFYKLWLSRKGQQMDVVRQKHYRFFHEQEEITMFYPMLADGDSLLWLGSREKGLVRFNMRTEEYQVVSLKSMLHKSVDDVLSLCRTKNGKMYVGTTSGLVCLTVKGKKINATYIGREQGLLNDMIHGVMEGDNGFLWLSTNRGLIKYNPKNKSSHNYYYSGGVQIGEFSDDAYYRCPYSGRILFGGIDGLLYLDHKVASVSEYYPDILLRGLWLGRERMNLSEYYASDGSLRLHGSEVSFSLSVAVPDYLTGEEVEYSFILEGYDKKWSAFGSSNEASYIDVPPGKYIFKVRYKKDVFDTEYKSFSITIHILPPWYRSVWAYGFYLLALAVLGVYVWHLLRKYMLHERILKRLLNTESVKGRNTGHSTLDDRGLLDSFTLIYYACDQLRTENISDEQRLKQVALIRETVMAALFSPDMLMGKKLQHFYPTTFALSARMCIQELSMEVLCALKANGTDTSLVRSAIAESYTFPVYKNALRCILFYCYYALCQKASAEVVTVEARSEEGRMNLIFSSSDNRLEELRNQLNGTAYPVYNKKDADRAFADRQMLCFVQAALEQLHATIHDASPQPGVHTLTLSFEPAPLPEGSVEEGKKTVLFLEDREERVWLVTGLLSEDYDVHVVKSVQTAFEELHSNTPAAFLVDMSMYAHEETTFIDYVNKNRNILAKTVFIPMLTWEASSTIQQKLIKGSDSYIVLPYDVLFLKETLHKAIYGKKEPKKIYLDDLGELSSLIVCTTAEQADFARKLLQVIELNLEQEDLGSTLIADRMAMSPRQFYRKFKEISQIAPGDLIKNYRLEKAARLLRAGELSIQDVIADVGISSRSYFYKEFSKKYGMTPKDYRDKAQS